MSFCLDFAAEDEDDLEHHSAHLTKRFTHSDKPLTLELIKGTLLAIADQMVTTIAEVIQENGENEKQGNYRAN